MTYVVMFWLLYHTSDMAQPSIYHEEMELGECMELSLEYLQKIKDKSVQGHYEVGCMNLIDIPRTDEAGKH